MASSLSIRCSLQNMRYRIKYSMGIGSRIASFPANESRPPSLCDRWRPPLYPVHPPPDPVHPGLEPPPEISQPAAVGADLPQVDPADNEVAKASLLAPLPILEDVDNRLYKLLQRGYFKKQIL